MLVISPSSSFKVQNTFRRTLAQRGARAIYSEILKRVPKCMYRTVKTSSTFYRMATWNPSLVKLSMVGQLTTVWPVGMVVPKSDGVREEGSLVDLGSGKRYKVVESITSNRDYWYEIRRWHVNYGTLSGTSCDICLCPMFLKDRLLELLQILKVDSHKIFKSHKIFRPSKTHFIKKLSSITLFFITSFLH